MTCGETREYLFAFLDNELDAPLSIELQRHIDGCPTCGQEAEIERTVRRQLAHALDIVDGETLSDGPTLQHMVEGVTSGRTGRASLRHRAVWFSGIAAALGLVVVTGSFLMDGDRTNVSGRFTDLVVQDFEYFLSEGRSVQIASSDPQTVSTWLREKTSVDVRLAGAVDLPWTLIGGRKCKIDGQRAAFAAYERGGVPASLVVMEREAGTLEEMNEARCDGVSYWVAHRDRYTVVARPHNELIYAAIGTTEEEELLRLIPRNP